MERLNIEVKKAIIYGSISFFQGKKVNKNRTHRWACYVRGQCGEDISCFIKTVVFKLHTTFVNPYRVVVRPPFEIHEYGWGEFEIEMKIYFHDNRESPLELTHMLQLYPKHHSTPLSLKKAIVSEHYDEIVFTNPYPEFYQRLSLFDGVPPDYELLNSSFHLQVAEHFQAYNEVAARKKLEDAYEFIRHESERLREKVRKVESCMQTLRFQLREEEEKQYNSATCQAVRRLK